MKIRDLILLLATLPEAAQDLDIQDLVTLRDFFGGGRSKACENCGMTIPLGIKINGRGSRSDRKFCSEACKAANHRLTIAKKKTG